MSLEIEPYMRATAPLARVLGGEAQASLPHQIAGAVRQRIQFGQIKPGERIREVPLAAEFEVSRGPVRDALKILARERLIELQGRAGAVVRELSDQELSSIFRIRAELSGLGMRTAAELADRPAATLGALDEGVELLRRIAASPDDGVAAYIQVRRRLSDIINHMSRKTYLARLMLEFEREIALPWAGVFGKERQKRSSEAWSRIVAAIRAGDADAADAEGRQVVLDSLEEMMRRRKAG